MKKLGFVALSLFAVCVVSVPAVAQEKWTYRADNGGDNVTVRYQEVTIIITQKPNGYEVSGEFREYVNDSWHTCPIHGTYYPKTERISARAKCEGSEYEITGFKSGPDTLALTEPFARSPIEIPHKLEEQEGSYNATWTLLPSGNQFEAKWNNGADAILKIEKWDTGGVRIVRGDTAASVSQGFSAVYTGKISGKSINGDVKFTQNGRSWSGTWSAKW